MDERIIWGPKLWRCLHLLAQVSDRRDVGLLWKTIFQATSLVLPCAICRQHMAQYLKTHVFMKIENVHLKKGVDIQAQIVRELIQFHNNVNKQIGKKTLTEEEAQIFYVGDRASLFSEAKTIFEELKILWKGKIFSAIPAGVFKNWVKVMSLLIAILDGGPN